MAGCISIVLCTFDVGNSIYFKLLSSRIRGLRLLYNNVALCSGEPYSLLNLMNEIFLEFANFSAA